MHIGIIMDGNGRFATKQGLPRLSGHNAGVQAVREIVKSCPAHGIHAITLYAFAIANWKRDKEEVDGLWLIFHTFISQDVQELIDQGVQVVVIGNRAGLPDDVRLAVEKVEEASKENTAFLLQIALNYDGVDEVARMLQRAIADRIAEKEATVAYVRTHLDTHAGNEPDIVIRTGMPAPQNGLGVWRSSAFLPLQSVQSVCVSTDVLWPDFTIDHLKEIIDFANPDARLFGGQRESVTSAVTA